MYNFILEFFVLIPNFSPYGNPSVHYVAIVTHFISSSSSLLAMLLNSTLLGNVLGGRTSVNIHWRNVIMAPVWSIVLAAAWEGANHEEAVEANTDNKPVNSW